MKLKKINGHERDENIVFIEKGHKYVVNGDANYISVTSFVYSLFPKFEPDLVIEKMMASSNWPNSKYYGMTPQEIKDEWKKTGRESSRLGNDLHQDIEWFLNDMEVFNESSEYKFFLKFFEEHDLKPYRTEWRVYDEDLRLAGSIDSVFLDEEGDMVLVDWKRSKEIKEQNSFEEGYYPISHIPNANYWKYALQLNLYKRILQNKYGINIKEMYIVCLHPNKDEYQKMLVKDMQREVDDLIQLRIEKLRT